MDPILDGAVELLPAYGPYVLFILATLETCFVTGLVVPAGVATSVATVMALGGTMALTPLVIGAALGAAAGDSVGFWVGRTWGLRALGGRGRLATAAREKHDGVGQLFGRHPVYSVTVARLISFVRTLMPMAAGVSEISYRRFLPYDVVGVVGWTVMYVAIGVVGRESWEAVTRLVGVGGAAVFAAVGLLAWWLGRRRSAVAPSGDGEDS